MTRKVVVPKSSINTTFLRMLQQNPDATLHQIIEAFTESEGSGALNKVTVTIQDIKSIESPDFDDENIKHELTEMMDEIINFIRECSRTETDYNGKTRAEIEKAIKRNDHLENFAFSEALKRMIDDGTLFYTEGKGRGKCYDLVNKKGK